MSEKYPTWLTGHVKEWAQKRLPTVTLCSTTGSELLEVWYYGDLLTVKGEPQSYIVDGDEAPGLVVARDPESGEDTLWYWTEEDPQELKQNVLLSNILMQYMNSARNSSKERTGSDVPTLGGLSKQELQGITNALGYEDVHYNDFADPDTSDNVASDRRDNERWMNLTGAFDPWEETDVIRAQDYGDGRYYNPMGTLAQWGFDFRTDALPDEPGWSDMLANYQNYLSQQQQQGAA